jgi:ankyrin repeat protein
MVLQVQDEMVVQKLSTDQTSAGRTVNADLQRIKLIFDQLAANLKQQYDNEKNEMVKRVFKVEQEQAQAKADKAEKSKQALASFSSPNPSYLSKSGATSLLISAVKSNNTKNARRLIRDNNANTDATDSRGRPILSLAVEQKHYDMVELLLKNDASPTKTDKYGTSPLHVAARAGYLRITTKLIDYATTLNKHDYDGRTPLYIACDNNRSRITKELLDRGAYIRARSARGNTVLHAAARQGFKDLCKILVEEYGANVNARNSNGRTAGRLAEKHGHPGTASWLRRRES